VTTQIPDGYTLSTTTGSLSGTTISNLCYGKVEVCMTFTATGCKKCDSLQINGTTAIQEISFDEGIILYPNPTNSDFYILNSENKIGSVKIFNVEGKNIREIKLERETVIANLNAGIYFVEIDLEGIVVRKKVVVLR
jgi:hypothetical protein